MAKVPPTVLRTAAVTLLRRGVARSSVTALVPVLMLSCFAAGMTGKSSAECDRRSMRYYPINCPQEVTPRRDSPLARNAAEVGVRPSDFIAHDREAHDFCSEEVKHRVPPARNCSSKIAHLSQATTLEQSDMAR
jgi:hypothetical protein